MIDFTYEEGSIPSEGKINSDMNQFWLLPTGKWQEKKLSPDRGDRFSVNDRGLIEQPLYT